MATSTKVVRQYGYNSGHIRMEKVNTLKKNMKMIKVITLGVCCMFLNLVGFGQSNTVHQSSEAPKTSSEISSEHKVSVIQSEQVSGTVKQEEIEEIPEVNTRVNKKMPKEAKQTAEKREQE